eukprot:6186647-Pleurochrysis_carterae.AAC.1
MKVKLINFRHCFKCKDCCDSLRVRDSGLSQSGLTLGCNLPGVTKHVGYTSTVRRYGRGATRRGATRRGERGACFEALTESSQANGPYTNNTSALIEPSSWRSLSAGVVSLFNSCGAVHEQHDGAAVKLGVDGVEQMAAKVAKERVSLDSNTVGCSFGLPRTSCNLEEAKTPFDRVVGKNAEVCNVCVAGLS